MIFDVHERNRKMAEYVDKIQDLVHHSELEGFMFLLRKTDGTHRQYIFPGRVTDFEWIGAVETLKFELQKGVKNHYRTDLDD